MRILGIETSCDETSVAIVDDGRTVRSNVIASSRAMFEKSGGVIPEEAAREQVRCMIPALHEALDQAKCTKDSIDAIAVTHGPGLLGSLLVGATSARILAALWQKPIIGVHHTLGHLSSTWLLKTGEDVSADPLFPILTLSASGGHTDLWLRESHTKGQLIGRTRDDAAGEAFDKGAALLGLPYPGGPSIAKTAETGNRTAFPFPHPLSQEDTLDYSFSGLKTALKYLLRDLEGQLIPVHDVAASYEHALCTHLIDRLERAIKRHPEIQEVHVVGGVSANTHLREEMQKRLPITARFPSALSYCTDNAAMIAAAGFFLWKEHGDAAFCTFETKASLPLTEAVHS